MISIFDEGRFRPCPAPFNLAAHVLAPAAADPDRIALVIAGLTGAERWSYGRMAAAVGGTAAGLAALGLEPGARIVLRLGNTVEFPIAFLGAIAAGFLPVPVSAQLTPAELGPMIADLAPSLVIRGGGLGLPAPLPCPVLEEETLRGYEGRAPLPFVTGDPGRAAYLIFTSGTSGRPRAVVHAHRAVWARQMMWEGWYGLGATDRLLHAGAFNWTYTLGTGLMDPWAAGATAIIPAAGVEPQALPLLLARHDATIFAGAPGVYRQMLKGRPVLDLPKLRHGLSAGEKLPEAVRAAWNAATGTMIYEALGMSECSTFISGSPGRPAPEGATGHPQTGRRVAVLDAAGAPVARGEPGGLAIDRDDPGLFLGYHGAPAETAARYTGTWFVTGDTVRMAEDGAITYLGRADDMLNAGGYRASPIEIETAMEAHPDIAECAAVELRVKADASVVALFYVPRAPLEEAVLAAHAESRLARYKQPRMFLPRETLPKSANGKINRAALRREWEAAHGPA